jgi:hypothetical protein
MTSSFDTRHAFRAVPLLFSFIAFILAMLALFAGNKPGVLEGYNIITASSPTPLLRYITFRFNLADPYYGARSMLLGWVTISAAK